MKKMKYAREGKPFQKYTVAIFGHEFIVDARDDQESHTIASHLFKKEVPDCKYGLTMLQDNAQHRKHEDKRWADPPETIPSVLAREEEKQREYEEDNLVSQVLTLMNNKTTAAKLEVLLKEVS